MALLPLLVVVVTSLLGVPVCGQETRCICWLTQQTTLFTYDMEKLNLGLPCVYRLTSIKTADSKCHLTVDLSMTSERGSTVTPAGLQYLVTSEGSASGGIIDGHGVRRIDPNHNTAMPIPMSGMTKVDGMELLAYSDDSHSYKLAIRECMITLDFKPGKYLGIYSHNFSTGYQYNMKDLCGDCDGTKNEMSSKLPEEMLESSLSSLRNRDAAMLYMTSQHISGGSRRCFDYKRLIDSCPHRLALEALDICGRLLDPKDGFSTCVRMRTFMGRVLDTYFDCVTAFCARDSERGCRYIRALARSLFCSTPSYLTC